MQISTFVRRRFGWLVVAAIALVALGDALFWRHGLYGGQLGFYLMAILFAAGVLRPAIWRDSRAWMAIAAAIVFAAAIVLEPGPLPWLLFWSAAGMAVLLPATARFDDAWRWAQRLALHGLRMPVAPFLDMKRVVKARSRYRRKLGSVTAGLKMIALPATGSVIIIILFTSANPVLDRLTSELLRVGLPKLSLGRMLFWSLLFIMAWGLLHPRPTQRLLQTFDGTGNLPMPCVTAASVTLSLVVFNLLFAVQNAMDVAYLGGLLAMPKGITLAEYAHRGAYPLIATALLAALFVLVTLRPGSTTAAVPAIRMMVILWIGQNLVLVGSSIVRTIDYIEAYSLTELRIAALAWMGLVALGLILVCWRMFKELSASWLINVNMAAAVLVMTAFCLVDTAAVAATWNVRHAREVGGRGAALDLCYLNRLDHSALMALIELEQQPGLHPVFRDRVRSVRTEVMTRLERRMADSGWTLRGAYILDRARNTLAGLPTKPVTEPGTRRCDGSVRPVESAARPNADRSPPIAARLTAESSR